MRRGPKISQGLALAIPFALRRGHVMVFLAALHNFAEFLITGNGLFVLVRVRLARRICAGIGDIEAEFADAIAGLRLVPRTGPVSCELWLYSRYGTLRHFRVDDTRLVAIDYRGMALDGAKPLTGLASVNGTTDTEPDPAPAGTVPAPAIAGTDPKNPIIRWLKKWNAGRKAGKSAGPADNCGLKEILDSAPPKEPAHEKTRKKPAGKKGTTAGTGDPEKQKEPGNLAGASGMPAAGETLSSPSVPVPPRRTGCCRTGK